MTDSASHAAKSYQVIARRYRPQLFRSVVGQRPVVQMLHREISDNRIGHGYLFCGPRGTGKTSMARIFAKALNCVKGPTTDPCGECSHCQEIAAGTHLDVIEVDAATYTQVENTRKLLEGISRSPFSARYKVYIIDEVHMFSTSSFNALLKNLEEPPEKVIFVLATTNPEKIPETVLSRCRRCNFERINLGDMTTCLGQILDQEAVTVRPEERATILSAIALAADGGLRDAQVLLDQCISLAEEELTLDMVRSLLGVVESDLFVRLLGHIVARDARECLLLVGNLVDRGRDLQRFVKMFMTYLRDVMLIKVGGANELIRVADAGAVELREILDRTTLPFLLNVVQQFLALEERMRGAAPPRFLLEFTLIKLTAIDPRLVIDPVLGGTPGPSGPEAGASSSSSSAASAPTASAVRNVAPAAPRGYVEGSAPALAVAREPVRLEVVEESSPTIEAIHTTDSDRWQVFTEIAGRKLTALKPALGRARLIEAQRTRLIFQLDSADRALMQLLQRAEWTAVLREAANDAFKRPLMIVAQLDESAPMPVPSQIPAADFNGGDEESFSPVEVPAPRARPSTQALQTRSAGPVDPPVSLQEALDLYPEFKEACSLVERHLGGVPALFNGREVREA